MISHSTIDSVRELPIYDVVSKYVPDLKKAGSSYRGCSPFNNEKTPSFYVVPSKNIFKDFSSGKGGTAITFVMEKQGIPYVEAVKELCGKFNITLEYDQNPSHSKEYFDEVEQLYKINLAAAKRYAEALMDVDGRHPAFIELIEKRRFTPDTILQWQLGYAPGDIAEYRPEKWRFLTETLVNKGLYDQGFELGLIKTTKETNYDAFRNRLIFPIMDHNGRHVGFGARALQSDQFNAKYLNSSDSRIFNKSKMLYGLHFATQAIRKHGFANLMEGYTDVISFHQSGFNNTVGTCGTALTEEQCKLLLRYTSRVVLIYDGDAAGENATLRSIDELMKFGFQISVVPMPEIEGKKVDPDELVRMFDQNENS